jgi:hypothetical protein
MTIIDARATPTPRIRDLSFGSTAYSVISWLEQRQPTISTQHVQYIGDMKLVT